MSGNAVAILPKGRMAIRGMICRYLGAVDEETAMSICEARWGTHNFHTIAKAAVGALGLSNIDPNAVQFFDAVRERSLLGRLLGLRNVPYRVRLLAMAGGTRGHWVGEHKQIPMSKPTLTGSSLSPLKVAAIVAATEESLKNPSAEGLLHRDLEKALADALDSAFIDAGNAGVSGERPASITNGATTIASVGDPVQDLKAMIEAFEGDLSEAHFVTDPDTATGLALERDTGGTFLFPDIGPRGGTLLGIPTLTSRGSPTDTSGGQITLLDPTGIAVGFGSGELAANNSGGIFMSDDPETDGVGTMVSLFQTETVAIKSVQEANWEQQRDDGVVVLTGASYG